MKLPFTPVLVCAAALLSFAVKASSLPRPVLNVKSYLSPSAAWSLEIDPSEQYGCGKGSYRMTAKGKEVWHAELPFTLCDAAVSDDGITVGYAYSHGFDGYKDGAGPGSLHVVILDAAGGIRLNDTVNREQSSYIHGSPEPLANGFMFLPRDDRFIMRIGSEGGEAWWAYRLSTGEVVKRFELRTTTGVTKSACYIISAKALPELPLTLVHWWHYDQAARKVGALFTLCDLDGHTVWSLEWPGDYTIVNNDEAESRLRDKVQRSGAILRMADQGLFELWSAAKSERVRFEATSDPTAPKGWNVKEVAREKYQPPAEEKQRPAPSVEQHPLPLLGSFVLRDQPLPGPIRSIHAFAFDGGGHIGFLRRDDRRSPDFVLIDSAGGVLAEVPLPMADHFAWIADSRWIITSSGYGLDGKCRAWWLDADKRSLTEIIPFDCPPMESVAGTGDGGFVALATQRQLSTSTHQLICFDSTGTVRWKHESSSDDKPATLFSPKDITVTGLKEIAVLDVIRHNVQLFDLDGAYHRTIDLKEAWKREPRYPSAITPDVDGGFIVHDFNGDPPFVRMKPYVEVRGEWQPRHKDGRAIDTHTGLRAAPDGSLWTSDGHSFVKLRDDGVARRILGSPPDDSRLGKIAAITGDQRGQLYAVDDRTGAVHVFDAEGVKLRVCKPAKDDFSGNVGHVHVAAADDGSIYLAMGGVLERQYLHFAPDGKRVGIEHLDVDKITQQWHPQPGTAHRLVLGYHAAFLVNQAGKTVRTMERRSDRRWLDHPDGAAFAGDGSFAILTSSSDQFSRQQAVCLFTRDGEPISTFPVPDGFTHLIGFNGTHVALDSGGEIRLYDRGGTVVQCYADPNPVGAWDRFLTRDGCELWIMDFATRQVDRYAMP